MKRATNKYKVNVDGVVFSSQNAAGLGVIIRDHEGKFIVGFSKNFLVPLGAIEVDAEAFEYLASTEESPYFLNQVLPLDVPRTLY